MNGSPPGMKGGIYRDAVTWYCYLLGAFFIFVLTIQGNVIPFLKTELGLTYYSVALHTSAIAIGAIIVGLIGDRVVQSFGRQRVLVFGTLVCAVGVLALCVASAPWASIASCLLIGFGACFIPTVIYAVLADIHGERRNIAISESAALNYAFATLAPLLTSMYIAISVGWRGAILTGAVVSVVIVLLAQRTTFPQGAKRQSDGSARLPPAYWAYWCALSFGTAIEFCVILWSVEFLGQVVGLSPAKAAAAAAAFVVGMFIGRCLGGVWIRLVRVQVLLMLQLAVILVGFLLYWGGSVPVISIAGLFILGLGVSLLYPLTVSLAIGAAGSQSDTASARAILAFGIALLFMPLLLGAIADQVGLRSAHWLVPVLVVAVAISLMVGRAVEKGAANSSAAVDTSQGS